jgi:hypothetical protein
MKKIILSLIISVAAITSFAQTGQQEASCAKKYAEIA